MNSMLIVFVCALVSAASAGVLLGGPIALAGPSDAAAVLGPDGSIISSKSLGGVVAPGVISAPVGPIASISGPVGPIGSSIGVVGPIGPIPNSLGVVGPIGLGGPVVSSIGGIGPVGIGGSIISRSVLAPSPVLGLGLGLGVKAW